MILRALAVSAMESERERRVSGEASGLKLQGVADKLERQASRALALAAMEQERSRRVSDQVEEAADDVGLKRRRASSAAMAAELAAAVPPAEKTAAEEEWVKVETLFGKLCTWCETVVAPLMDRSRAANWVLRHKTQVAIAMMVGEVCLLLAMCVKLYLWLASSSAPPPPPLVCDWTWHAGCVPRDAATTACSLVPFKDGLGGLFNIKDGPCVASPLAA